MYSIKQWRKAVFLLQASPDVKTEVVADVLGYDYHVKSEYNYVYNLIQEVCSVWKIERKVEAKRVAFLKPKQ